MNYIIVSKDRKYGLLDKSFKFIVPIEYKEIEKKSNNCILLHKLNNNDRTITKIFNPQKNKYYGPYLNVNYLSDNFISVDNLIAGNIEDSPSFNNTNKLENHIIDIINEKDIVNNNSNLSLIVSKKFQNKYVILSSYISSKGFMDGVVDFSFNQIFPFEYEKITNIDNRFLLLNKDGVSDLVTIDKKIILSSLKAIKYVSLVNDIICISFEDGSEKFFNKKGELLYNSTENVYLHYLNEDKYLLTNKVDSCNMIVI